MYALILDRKGIVQAHTDSSKILKSRNLEAKPESVTKEGGYEYFSRSTFSLSSGMLELFAM